MIIVEYLHQDNNQAVINISDISVYSSTILARIPEIPDISVALACKVKFVKHIYCEGKSKIFY